MRLTQQDSAALMRKLSHSSVKFNHFTSFHRCNPTGSAVVLKALKNNLLLLYCCFTIDEQKSYNVVVLLF